MGNTFKVGDIVELIPKEIYLENSGFVDSKFKTAMRVEKVYSSTAGSDMLQVIALDGSWGDSGLYAERFMLCKENISNTKQIAKVDYHIILQDSCRNFLGLKNSYKEAEEFAKQQKEAVTIYKLAAVSKVTTERKVAKITSK